MYIITVNNQFGTIIVLGWATDLEQAKERIQTAVDQNKQMKWSEQQHEIITYKYEEFTGSFSHYTQGTWCQLAEWDPKEESWFYVASKEQYGQLEQAS
jgi:hypothetical protein